MNKTKKINRSKHLKKETEIKTERKKSGRKEEKQKIYFLKRKNLTSHQTPKMFFSQ